MADGQLDGVLQHVRKMVAGQSAGSLSDGELLERFARHRDEAAFAALVQRHAVMVLSVCRRVLHHVQDAEDACQAAFLVLARKAGSIRKQESVGSWLHGVAYRIAANLKRSIARRSAHEGPFSDVPQADTTGQVTWQEVRALLDEELQRLPRHYRAPLVLCYLEGKTRDEAAQELGWGLGALRGRLERGRDLLRLRLTRRGLTLSAALLATALTENTSSSAPPVALTSAVVKAATLLAGGQAAYPVVSARVAVLLQGALRTMFLNRIKTVVPALLAVVALGVGGGLLASRTHSQEQSRPQPMPQEEKAAAAAVGAADDFGPEVKGLRARVTLAREAFEVGQPIEASYTVKNVAKEEQTIWLSGFWPNHEIIVRDAAGKEPPLTTAGTQRRQAFAPGGDRDRNVPVKLPPGGEDATEGKYDLATLYDLSKPGRYTVQYFYEEKQGGWEGRLPSNVAAFEVLPGGKKEEGGAFLAESEAVRVAGLKFVALVAGRTPLPEASGARSFDLGLRVTNVADKPVALATSDVIRPRLFTEGGTELKIVQGRDGKPPPTPPTLLWPGASWTWGPEARLGWTKTSTLQFWGPDGHGVPGFWSFDGLKAGKYRLVVEYTNRNARQGDVDLWVGTAATAEAKFELVARVKQVDFQATAEAKCLTPAPGGQEPLDLSLRLTNRSDRPLLFNLSDTLWPVLRSADGTSFKRDGGRWGTSPAPPVLVGPGKGAMVVGRAHLEWLPDGKSLRLVYPDGSGGGWYFDGLVPGKYLLSFAYENSEETLATFLRARPTKLEEGQSFWTGKVTTNEVEFEITPARQGSPEEQVKRDKEQLRGTWVAVSWESSGKPLPRDEVAKRAVTLTFTDKEVLLGPPSAAPARCTYKLDPTKQPKEMDLDLPRADVELSFRGIYEVEGDTLKLCQVTGDANDRPREFATAPGESSELIVLKRQKP
jgi:RNA polymerase sigma factor (sigma-70 family)